MQNFNDVPLPSADVGFSGAIHNRTRWDDHIKWFSIPDKVVVTLRFFGPVYVTHNHWFATKKGKKFPLVCPSFDPQTQMFVKGKCPVEDDFNIPLLVEEAKRVNPLFNEETDPSLKEIKGMKAHMAGFGHVIVRNQSFQTNENGVLKPWQAIKLQPSILFTLIKLKSMNRCTIGGKIYEADVADPYWGRDVHIMYNASEKNPQARYIINLGDHTPLTEVEKTYLTQLYDWKNIVEYPSYDEVKQILTVNGYYTHANVLRGGQSFGGDSKQQNQYAHMEQYLPQVPKSPYEQTNPQAGFGQQQPPQNYGSPQMGYPQQQPQQPQHVPPMPMGVNNFPPMPQQGQFQQPQMQQQQYQQQQQPIPQMGYPPAPNPMSVSAMGLGLGLVEADVPMTSPLPTNVPPVLGNPVEDDFEIPFGGDSFSTPMPNPVVSKVLVADPTGKKYVVKGKPTGVGPDEFQQVINDFGTTLARGKPFKPSEDPELEGLNVLACYGSYCGDLNCVKCPLRQYCLHA
jgi:hypothetical protein